MDSNPNILLVFPKLGHDIRGVSFEPPMCYLCTAAPLLREGYQVTILDQRVMPDFYSRLKNSLARKPVFVGLSVMTGMQISYALKIAKYVRRLVPDIPIVFGGVHPSLMPEQMLQNKLVDIIVRGEGEETALDLVDALVTGGDLGQIDGLSFIEEGTTRHNPDRPYIDLNSQPEIPYHLVPIEKYLMGQVPGYRRSLDVYTSRGCPYACTFCYNQSFNKRNWRPIHIERIIRNIRYLASKYNIDSVFFNDDNMFVNLPRVYEICDAIVNELPNTLPWGSVGSRIDVLSKCDYDKLVRSGCKTLFIGIESGSDSVLSTMKKGITVSQALDVVRDLSRTSIIPHYNFMTGYIGERYEDLQATLDLIDQILDIDPKAYISSLHVATPYPGTPFYFEAIERGWTPPQTLEEWSNIYWEKTDVPWLDKEMKRRVSNISILSYFIDHKVADRLNERKLMSAGVWLFGKMARFRWKHRWFDFCPDLQLLKKLNERSILR